jgi:hypothetical protein
MDFLTAIWLGMPVWIWFAFITVVLGLLVFDLGVMHRDAKEIGVRESLRMSALYIGLGLAWAIAVYWIYFTYSGATPIDPQIAAAGVDRRPALCHWLFGRKNPRTRQRIHHLNDLHILRSAA